MILDRRLGCSFCLRLVSSALRCQKNSSLSIESLRLLNSPDGIRIVREPVYLTLRHFKSTTTRSLDNTADSLQQAALNHSIDRQFFPRQLSQSSLNFLESDLDV